MNPRRVLTPLLLVVATVATLAVLAGACGGDEPSTGSGAGESGSTTESTAADHADGAHSGMEPELTSVAELSALGPGPAVGDTFHGHIGLNVCGRFLAPPAASTPDDGSATSGVTTDGQGTFTVTPSTEAVAGHHATIGTLAAQAGIELGTGSVTFPASTDPAQIDVGGTSVAVAGRTFGPDFTCGGTPTEVQLWVYTADAVESGDPVRKVVEDPADAPIVEDGMAFVIAVTPESSLPTLPPSAILS